MKVLVLGTGAMGALACTTIATFPEITALVVADRDETAARACAAQCGPKATPVTLDVTDDTALQETLTSVDIVLNCVGPFFRFGVPILTAAIDTGTHYMDICDDPEPTLEMLALHEKARATNVLAIIGMGASPGISNLLAAMTCQSLDTIDDLTTGWSLEGDGDLAEETGSSGEHPSAAVVHWMEQCSGTVTSWVDGQLVQVKPLRPLKVTYPGIGKRTLWTVGHPEPVTLPVSFPQIRNASNAMVLNRFDALGLQDLQKKIDGGALTADTAAQTILKSMAADKKSLVAKLMSWVGARLSGPAFPSLFAIATGTKDGRRAVAAATVRAMPTGGMAGATAIPLAVALKRFAQGKISGKGVVAPEAAIDPDLFFAEFAPYCTQPAAVEPAKLVDFRTG